MKPPYEGSRAMLRIGKCWITSKYKYHLYEARRAPPFRLYMKEKYKWTDEVFDSIDWEAIGRCRNKQSITKKMNTCKIMHGWLPTMNKNFTSKVDQCPGCVCPNETTNHVLVCPNVRMVDKREEIVEALRKKGLGKSVPRSVEKGLLELIIPHLRGTYTISKFHAQVIRDAIRDQKRVGAKMLLRGFIVKGWHRACKDAGVSHPERAISSVLTYIWDNIFDVLWKVRNDLLHHQKNKVDEAESAKLAESLVWYTQHKDDVLPIYDRHLVRFDASDIHRMSNRVKREWMRHLCAARRAFQHERMQRKKNQAVITRYLIPVDALDDTVAEEPQYANGP